MASPHGVCVVNTYAIAVPEDSLLRTQLDGVFRYEDMVEVRFQHGSSIRAETLLAGVLDGFINNPPKGVGRLMAVRNVLVKPLRLRTAKLGCPVSSLEGGCGEVDFAGRFAVRSKQVTSTVAQVVLGADDKHLRFRSCVSVRINQQTATIQLGTRVQPLNAFGRFYMAAIHHIHTRYIEPTMLKHAVNFLMNDERLVLPITNHSFAPSAR